jgi:hypothetical protein
VEADNLIKIIENDWNEYFSLKDLMNAKCHQQCTAEKNLVMDKNGTFKFKNVLVDFSKKYSMNVYCIMARVIHSCLLGYVINNFIALNTFMFYALGCSTNTCNTSHYVLLMFKGTHLVLQK